jgi:Xaa-Pro dipeptidase
MHEERVARLGKILKKEKLDAYAVIPGPTMVYLSGLAFHLMERPTVLIFLADDSPTIIAPSFERSKAERSAIQLNILDYGEDMASRAKAFKQAGETFGNRDLRIGYETLSMRAFELGLLEEFFPGTTFLPRSDIPESMRRIKDDMEVAAHRNAVAIAEKALINTLALIKFGMTEKELAAELVVQLLRGGSEPELPFFPIVGSGPNSALPHATTTDRALQHGDALLIDYGARNGGYISDITRTFMLGEATVEFKEIHNAVRLANAAGVDAVRPGATCGDIDRATRNVIEEAGFGEYFRHRTGHGIGLEAHEEPYIRGDNEELLIPGMMFTVEPGVYLLDQYGVRIEENVLVTSSGRDVLTSFPRELQILL